MTTTAILWIVDRSVLFVLVDCLPAGISCPVTTDLNLSSGAAVPDSVTPSSAADVPAPAASPPIRIQAQIKAAAWVGGDVATTLEVSSADAWYFG